MNSATLVQKLWNYCNVRRDDGMSYGDYVEQLTYLLFLKMAHARSRPPYNQPSLVPAQYARPVLLARDGDALFNRYRLTLEALGNEKGTLGPIFGRAQNKCRLLGSVRRRSVRSEEPKSAVIEERQLGGGRVLQSDSRLSGICVG